MTTACVAVGRMLRGLARGAACRGTPRSGRPTLTGGPGPLTGGDAARPGLHPWTGRGDPHPATGGDRGPLHRRCPPGGSAARPQTLRRGLGDQLGGTEAGRGADRGTAGGRGGGEGLGRRTGQRARRCLGCGGGRDRGWRSLGGHLRRRGGHRHRGRNRLRRRRGHHFLGGDLGHLLGLGLRLRLGEVGRLGHCRGAVGVGGVSAWRAPANDEALGGDGGRSGAGLALLDDALDRGRGLVVLERARVALHVVAECRQLGDDLLVVEIDAEGLQLLGNLVNSLLRHRPLRNRCCLLLQKESVEPLQPQGHPSPECPDQRPSLHRRSQASLAAEVSAAPRLTLLPIPPQLALARQAEPHQLFLGMPGPASDARSDRPAAQGAFASSVETGAGGPSAARSASSSARSLASSNR